MTEDKLSVPTPPKKDKKKSKFRSSSTQELKDLRTQISDTLDDLLAANPTDDLPEEDGEEKDDEEKESS